MIHIQPTILLQLASVPGHKKESSTRRKLDKNCHQTTCLVLKDAFLKVEKGPLPTFLAHKCTVG